MMPKTIPWRLIAYLGGLILIIVLFSALLSQCHSTKTAKKQNEVSQGEAGAAIDSGSAAVNTLGGVISNDAATDATVTQGKADIHAAPEGHKAGATKKAVCALKAYRDSPQCKEPAK